MSLVIRRKTLDCHGRRYFAKPNPAAHLIDHARRFDTSAEAETERLALREPWLWETLDEVDAANRDIEEARSFRERMMREEKRDMLQRRLFGTTTATIAALSAGLAIPGERR